MATTISATDDVEVTPGTVHLVDAQGSMNNKHAKGADHDIVLVPAPSRHPDDPLNWAKRRKLLCVFCMMAYVLVLGICSSALYSTLGSLSDATGLTYGDLNAGTGYMFLLFGWGCVFWQAVAHQYGKRPVYLITTAGTLGVMIWQPHISSNGQWIAAKILQGIFGAPIESIAEITVSDVFFTHERGTYLALYALALGYSNGLAPLMMGFINDGMGYKWVFYWCGIFCGGLFIILFFFMEETKFDRHLYSSTAEQPNSENIEATQDAQSEPSDQLEVSSNKAKHAEEIEDPVSPPVAAQVTHGTVETLDSSYAKKSYLARLKPVERKNLRQKNHMIKLLWLPFTMYIFPLVIFAGFLYGSNIIWLTFLNATEALLLSNDPYNMSTSAIGLTFIAPLVGTSLAAIYTGYYGDRFILKMARRNGGYFEAEHRLWLLVPSLVLIPFGCILFGVGGYHHAHWFGIVFAMGVISFTTTAGSQISIAYTIDCYRDMAGDAIAAVIIIRNTMAFGIGYAVTPWAVNMGFQNAFILGGFLGLAHNLTIFPVLKWGRKIRQRSAEKYWKKVKAMAGFSSH